MIVHTAVAEFGDAAGGSLHLRAGDKGITLRITAKFNAVVYSMNGTATNTLIFKGPKRQCWEKPVTLFTDGEDGIVEYILEGLLTAGRWEVMVHHVDTAVGEDFTAKAILLQVDAVM